MVLRTTFGILALLLVAPVASARTAPRRGAVSKPRLFKIRAPFPCGVTFKVNCSYGQRAHRRVRATHATNDYYALDFTRMTQGGGFREPVVAVAPGIVRRAGWARRGWAPYGKVVYIEHDFRDRRGRRYQSLYAHLRSVRVRAGQRVAAGDVIATLGGSSRGRYRRFGPHLHFALYRGAKRYMGGGRAVVPEPLGSYEDIRRGMVMQACGKPAPRFVLLGPEDQRAVGGLADEAAWLPTVETVAPIPSVLEPLQLP